MSEHQQREWKAAWRDEYLKWICGFANAEGGVLGIGRSDSGVRVGVANAALLLEDIPNKVRDVLSIMVDVNLREEAGKFDESLSGLMITFRAYPLQLAEALGVAPATTQEISPASVPGKIVALLRQQPATTRLELAKQLELSPEGVKYHLNKLRTAGVIRRVGPTKSGHWEVLK